MMELKTQHILAFSRAHRQKWALLAERKAHHVRTAVAQSHPDCRERWLMRARRAWSSDPRASCFTCWRAEVIRSDVEHQRYLRACAAWRRHVVAESFHFWWRISE